MSLQSKEGVGTSVEWLVTLPRSESFLSCYCTTPRSPKRDGILVVMCEGRQQKPPPPTENFTCQFSFDENTATSQWMPALPIALYCEHSGMSFRHFIGESVGGVHKFVNLASQPTCSKTVVVLPYSFLAACSRSFVQVLWIVEITVFASWVYTTTSG